MGKIPDKLRETIARNIRKCRLKKFPGRGGGKLCAETFGVSPQQWSPWESGKPTPDELRLEQIAIFFGVTVEWLRQDHRNQHPPLDTVQRRAVEEYRSSGIGIVVRRVDFWDGVAVPVLWVVVDPVPAHGTPSRCYQTGKRRACNGETRFQVKTDWSRVRNEENRPRRTP